MIKSNYIVFDCETGGLDPTKNPITQYAAIILDGSTLKELDRFETFVKPYGGLTIEKQALDSTMVRMSDINGGLSLKEFVSTITEFWESHRVKNKNKEMGRLVSVGHNVTFDIGFIDHALALEDKGDVTRWMFPNFIDTWGLAKLAWCVNKDEKTNLGASCERAGIRLTDAHGAMNDVEATAELLRWFQRQLRRKGGGSSLKEGRAIGSDFFEFKCSKI